MDWTHSLRYAGLDADATYTLKLIGVGDAKPRAKDTLLEPTQYGKEESSLKVFPVPQELTKDGTLVVTFDKLEEGHLNWRLQSRLSEAWLIRNP